MSSRAAWSYGDVIVVRDVFEGRVWAERPVIVVEDSDELVALWCPQGTMRKVPITPESLPAGVTRGEWLAGALGRREWALEDAAWDVSSLMLHREGDWHAVWLSFLASGEQWGWYVNFQEPFRRADGGIETMDLALDIIAEPDRSSWRWKDEDEFELLIERGVIGPDVASRVRVDAEAVIERIERDEPPFDSEWPAWRPDPAWAMPTLPR